MFQIDSAIKVPCSRVKLATQICPLLISVLKSELQVEMLKQET